MKPNTIVQFSVVRLQCSECGAEANASCNCGKLYLPAKQRAREAIKHNPEKSDRAIAADIGVSHTTVANTRREVGGNNLPPAKIRTGQDGKRYSIRQRVVGDGIDPEVAADAAATDRRRVFLRCAADAQRKATLGAGLRDATAPEIDAELIAMARQVAAAWATLADTLEQKRLVPEKLPDDGSIPPFLRREPLQ